MRNSQKTNEKLNLAKHSLRTKTPKKFKSRIKICTITDINWAKTKQKK